MAEDALRASEARLRESEDRYRAFVANSSEGIWRIEFSPPVDTRLPVDEQITRIFRDGRFAECNDAFARMYGFASSAEVVGRGLALMMDERQPEVREYLAGVIAAGYRANDVESAEHDREGRPLWFANSLSGVVQRELLVRAWGTQRDITDRKKAEFALREADRRKDEFLATLAHELRNPLAPIRSAVEVLRLQDPGDPVLRRHREVIARQVSHLARLIDDLMDVSRIARNKIALREAPVLAQDVVRAALESSREEVDAGRHPVQVLLPQEPLPVHGDEVRLVQVVMNLVTNAARYSAAGTPIEVTAAREGDWLRLAVRDQGQGIPSGDHERVFELFYQGESGTQRSHGGLGIGLSLVKRLTELHGGRVEARSAGPGRGSEFVVWLPLAEGPVPQPAPASAPATRSASRRILIVDDNRDSANTLAEVLRLLGHEVQTAYDGASGLREGEALQPEVVLMDLGMPQMDGFQACRAMRATSWGGAARMLAVSGWGQASDVERSRAAGFDGHLVKPVSPADLIPALG